jgi:hypothetical protein
MACLDEHKDSKINFSPYLPFSFLNLSSPIGLAKNDKHCVQFADSISASKVSTGYLVKNSRIACNAGQVMQYR